MITFRIFNRQAGEASPHVEPRAFYKAFLQHVNRRNTKSHVHVQTRYYSNGNIVKTATIDDVDRNNLPPTPAHVVLSKGV